MIGDAKAKGKSRGAKAYMGKNSEGRSHKINLPSASDGGGDSEQKPTAKRMDKHNARPGTGTRDKQNPPSSGHVGSKHGARVSRSTTSEHRHHIPSDHADVCI